MSLKKVPSFLLNFSEAEMSRKEMLSYTFKSFRLDLAERLLLNNNKPVPLTPKAFDVLVFLVEHGGHLVEKDELMETVWADSFVEEANISRIIHTLRKALGEDENGNKYIETVAKSGYRFVAKVNEIREPVSEPHAPLLPEEGGPKAGVVGAAGGPIAAEKPRSQSDGSDLLHKIPQPAIDKTVVPTVNEQKHTTRFILFTVGFASALFLIFMLSFNFQSSSSTGPNDVGSTPQRQYTTNDEAYRLYLLGSALADKLTREDARKAIEAFEQAVKLDPNYAPAYAGLANVHTAIAFMGVGGNPTEEYLKAKTAVEKALAIDDNLAEAHSYLGELKTNFEWDFAAAEGEHKRAIELNPNSAAARRMYALLLSFLGRPDESVGEIKTAIDLEPASVLNHKIYQQTLFYARRYDESIAEGKRTLELDPEFLGVFDTIVGSYLMKGDDDQAFDWFLRQCELKKNKPDEIESWKTIYAQSGWGGIFERQLEQAKEAEKNGDPNPMPLARLYTKTGDPEQAFIYLEKAFEKRWQGMTSLKVSPSFDPLRSDPRFEDLVRRVGLR